MDATATNDSSRRKMMAQLATRMMSCSMISLCMCGPAFASQDPPSQQQVARWIALLQSDDFGERELAMTKLSAAGSAALPPLEELACSKDLEASRRAVEIIARILESVDANQFSTVRKTLERVVEQGSAIARREAEQLLQTIADPKFCLEVREQLSAGIAAAAKEEMHPEVVQDDLVDKLKKASGFRFASGSHFQGYDWRKATQPSDHPEVLVYRIRWFASGWSRWFVPGINDKDTKTPDGLMWRYFMDHQYEMVSLTSVRGDFVTREDFLPPSRERPAADKSDMRD